MCVCVCVAVFGLLLVLFCVFILWLLNGMCLKALLSAEDRAKEQEQLNSAVDAKNPGQKQGMRTNQLKCGKCGKRDVEYYEVQLRSADEPMTVIASCAICGHRWRQ